MSVFDLFFDYISGQYDVYWVVVNLVFMQGKINLFGDFGWVV